MPLPVDPLVTQLELLDLAGSGEREFLHLEPLPWGLVGSQVFAHVREQLVLVDVVTRGRAHKRGNYLAPFLIRQADYRNLADSVVSIFKK